MFPVRVGDKDAAVIAVDLGELLAGLSDGGGVDNRQHFLKVFLEQSEK